MAKENKKKENESNKDKSKNDKIAEKQDINKKESKNTVHQEDSSDVSIKETSNEKPNFFKWKRPIIYLFIAAIFFNIGQYYETRNRGTVYILNEAKFIKLASFGIATENKAAGEALSDSDREKVKKSIEELNEVLKQDYLKHPVLVQKQQSYMLLSDVQKIDITEEVIKKVIGEKRWEAIGKELGTK